MKKRILRKREKIMKNKIFLVLFLFLIFFNYLIYTNEISDSGDDFELLDIILRLESREISHPQDLVALIDFETFGNNIREEFNTSFKVLKDFEPFSKRFKDFIFNKSFIMIFSLLIIFFLILYIIRKKRFKLLWSQK